MSNCLKTAPPETALVDIVGRWWGGSGAVINDNNRQHYKDRPTAPLDNTSRVSKKKLAMFEMYASFFFPVRKKKIFSGAVGRCLDCYHPLLFITAPLPPHHRPTMSTTTVSSGAPFRLLPTTNVLYYLQLLLLLFFNRAVVNNRCGGA